MKAANIRIPLFFEVDIEAGPPHSSEEHPGNAVVVLHATGGRIVMEDGTILGEIEFSRG